MASQLQSAPGSGNNIPGSSGSNSSLTNVHSDERLVVSVILLIALGCRTWRCSVFDLSISMER